ncbi:hypothetical protein BGZ52_003928 [Haplosporangium bisporale]|nr:hypothetical protein BGZ52_003928 [Haplosporangium bisporale]
MSNGFISSFSKPKTSPTPEFRNSASLPNLITQQPLRRPSMSTSPATMTAIAHSESISHALTTSTTDTSPTAVSFYSVSSSSSIAIGSTAYGAGTTKSGPSAATQLLTRMSEEIKQRPWRPLPDKRLQINVKRIDLNEILQRPYVILTLGDQSYQTSISEREHGDWNEGFELRVTYHAQLFDSLQLDLYDRCILLRDRHVGRAEIKLSHLEGLPESFTSFYEIWDRTKSASTMSNLAGKKTLSSNIGAIQLRVHYRYQKPPQPEDIAPEATISIVPAPRISSELEDDSNFLAQLSEAMMDEASDTRFQKYEDPDNKESQSQNELKFAKVDDDDTAVQYPILDMVGSWTIAPETQKVVKAVVRMASAFGQGFELTNAQILTAVVVLERYYRDVTSERMDTGLATLEQVEHAGYFWRFSMACYSAFDTLTDLVCEYQQWKGGLVHGGMKTSADWFMNHLVPQIVAYIAKHKVSALNIVGHSLGGGTASILTMMLLDHQHEFQSMVNGNFRIQCHAFAPACSVSKDLADKYRDHIRCYVYEDDIVSRLSYGSMMDVKTMMLGAVEAASHMGLTKVFLTGTDEDWKPTLEAVSESRRRIKESPVQNPKLYIAGAVFQLWRHLEEQDCVEMKPASNRLCEEVLIKPAALSQHLLGILDNAFPKARESSMMIPSNQTRSASPTTLANEATVHLIRKKSN